LQRHVARAHLVAGEPHGPGAAAAERPKRAVASQHERPRRECGGRRRHPRHALAAAGETPLPGEEWATVGRVPRPQSAMTERDSDIEFDFFEDLEPPEPGSEER